MLKLTLRLKDFELQIEATTLVLVLIIQLVA